MTDINTLLVDAMNSEIEAKKFYLDASAKAQSNAGKKFFNELAQFEQRHFENVKKIIESRNENMEIELPDVAHDILSINSEVDGEFEPNKDEIISVINQAIEAEKKAQDRYKIIARIVDDESTKKIFEDLAQDEENHQKILEDEIYQLSNKGTIIWE